MKEMLNIRDVAQGGLALGLKHDSIPLWEDGSNIVFEDAGVRPIPAQIPVVNKPIQGPARGGLESRVDGYRTLIWAALQGAEPKLFRRRENEGAATNVSRTSGGAYSNNVIDETRTDNATFWSFANWGSDTVVGTDGVNPIQIYKGTTFENIAGTADAPTYAKIVARIQQHLLALNTNNGDNVVEWCSENDIDGVGAWTPAINNSAGNLVLRHLSSAIISAVPLGESLAVYGTDEMFAVEYVGPPYYFGQRLLLTNIGSVSRYGVVPAGRIHYGLSHRGIFRTDGISMEYIDNPQLHDYLFQGWVNLEQISKTVGVHLAGDRSVVWFLCTKGSMKPNAAIQYNYGNQTFTRFSFGRSFGTSGDVFFFPHLIDNDGNVFQLQVGDIAPSVGESPFYFDPECTITAGYGEAGYGEGGWGELLVYS